MWYNELGGRVSSSYLVRAGERGMARLSLSLLGGFQATLDGERVIGFRSAKVRALLAYLAAEADRSHRRETLATLL